MSPAGQQGRLRSPRWAGAAAGLVILLGAVGCSGTNTRDERVTLPPGAYTAEVKSKNGNSGITLLEFYEIP